MGSPPRADGTESDGNELLSDTESLRSILAKAKQYPLESSAKETARKKQIERGIKELIEERRELARSKPLKIHVNGANPPVLVISISGTAYDRDRTEALIEKKVMEEVVRDNAGFFNNNMRVVLDLRELYDVSYSLSEIIAYQWGGYVNYRSSEGGKVAVVQPRREHCAKVLEASAHALKLGAEIMADTDWKVMARARDVKSFMDG